MKNKWKNRPWQDSNLQSSDSKSDALSIRPQGQRTFKGSVALCLLANNGILHKILFIVFYWRKCAINFPNSHHLYFGEFGTCRKHVNLWWLMSHLEEKCWTLEKRKESQRHCPPEKNVEQCFQCQNQGVSTYRKQRSRGLLTSCSSSWLKLWLLRTQPSIWTKRKIWEKRTFNKYEFVQ